MLSAKVEETIKQHNLIEPGEKVGVAVSGGVDSMVLLRILSGLSGKMGFSVVALHFEHGIRGGESLRDMAFVEHECALGGIACICGRGNVPAEIAETGESPEAVARRQRYAFFYEQKQALGLQKIAVAHHCDDGAETFLFNLIRGSGISGVTAMKYMREPGVIRPMLGVSRGEIEQYARENGIAYVTDSSNFSPEYARNYIRSEIIPRMRRLNPEVSQAIMRTSEILLEEDLALQEYAGREYARTVRQEKDRACIDLDGFNALSLAVRRRIFRRILDERFSLVDITKGTVDELMSLAAVHRTGSYFSLDDKFFARVSYNTLIISEKMYTINRSGIFSVAAGRRTALWPGEEICVEISAPPAVYPDETSLTQYADCEAFHGAEIRARKEGDRFTPFGMQDSKKLKDWMIDSKIPREIRGGIPLLALGGEVLWIVGYALSEKLRVAANAAQAYKVSYIFHNGSI